MWSTAIRVISSNGEVKNYSSINQACKDLGLHRSSISKCLEGKQKQTKGYTIERGDVYSDLYSGYLELLQKNLQDRLNEAYEEYLNKYN